MKERREGMTGAQGRLEFVLLLLLVLADLPSSHGFEDENNCGLFEPEPQQSQMARVKVRRFFCSGCSIQYHTPKLCHFLLQV